MNDDERLARVAEVLSDKNFSNIEKQKDVTPMNNEGTFLPLTKPDTETSKHSEIKETNAVSAKKKVLLSLTSKPSSVEDVNVSVNKKKEKEKTDNAVTVVDYLYGELRRGYLLENDEQRFTERREKFYIFLKIPREIEKFFLYGFFQCVDAFLFLFTFLPLRSALSIWFLITRTLKLVFSALFGTHHSCRSLQPAEICDLLKVII
ncbi:UNVERIFIED_CONTAM: Protein TAPT1-like protein [Trichonephila clavipes]